MPLFPLALALALQPQPQPVATTPAPPLEKITPNAIVDQAPPAAWRAIDPDNLLLIELEGGKRVAIELAPDFAPVHVENIRHFARAGWWYDAEIVRVQDNYVTQWGVDDPDKPLPAGVVATPPAEYVRSLDGLKVTGLGYADPYAAGAGFADGWPVALYSDGTASLTHCYGAVGVGRGYDPDTGTGSELYTVIGHAPRHLDRNIAIVGRIIDGMEHMTALPRGTEALGFYAEGVEKPQLERVYLASMVEPAERPAYEVLRETSDEFARYKRVRANRNDDFYKVQQGGVDLCNVQVPVRPVE